MATPITILIFALLTGGHTALAQLLDRDDRWISGISYCGCQECNNAAYNALANGHTCGNRILNLIFEEQLTEEEACARVAGVEFPDACGRCNPQSCDGRGPPPPIAVSEVVKPSVPTFCDCPSCNQETWNKLVGFPAYSCGARIDFLQKTQGQGLKAACTQVSNEFRDCARCNSQTCNVQAAPEMRPAIEVLPARPVEPQPVSVRPPNTRCGCSRCTENILNSDAKGHSCKDRIDFLLSSFPHMYPREEDACRQVAHVEFPGHCGPQCDPDLCHGSDNAQADAHTLENVPTNRGHSRDMDLYCFPPDSSRQTYENVWGKYTVQPKTDVGGGVCGPGENMFSEHCVSLDNNGRNLKLQYKKVGNEWHGSEVRILLPEAEMPYRYGSYTFSVKSIRVFDSQTGSFISNILPPSLVLGLFTWDPLEDYSIHENYNHEVDVEISRWGVANNADAQFLVQPPGDPQMHRFFTGSNGVSFQQAPRIYGFNWLPTEIEWYSNAGLGGQHFSYSTQAALDAGQPDYNQCMPSNAEVRINLWNLFGNSSNPPEMEDTHVVEVVIDNFHFVPFAHKHVDDGAICSKDCHCSTTSRCLQNRCTPIIRRNGATRRRLESDLHEVLGQHSVVTVPVVLLLMVANLVLALTVIRRHCSSTERTGELPFESGTTANKAGSEKTFLEAHTAVVD